MKSEEKLTDESEITFGVHTGKKLKDIPIPYLMRLYNKGYAFGALRLYIYDRLDVFNAHASINNKNRFFDKKYYTKK